MTYRREWTGVLVIVVVAGLALAGCGGSKSEPKKPPKAPAVGVPEAPEPGAEVQVAQTICPVLGEKLKNRDIYVDYNGRRVYFCCQMCVDTFKKDPEKYIKVLDEQRKKAGHAAEGGEAHEAHGH